MQWGNDEKYYADMELKRWWSKIDPHKRPKWWVSDVLNIYCLPKPLFRLKGSLTNNNILRVLKWTWKHLYACKPPKHHSRRIGYFSHSHEMSCVSNLFRTKQLLLTQLHMQRRTQCPFYLPPKRLICKFWLLVVCWQKPSEFFTFPLLATFRKKNKTQPPLYFCGVIKL